jgi:uncharacterized RmlC-like cupin family protein
VRIGSGELLEIEGPNEIRRLPAFAKSGLWAGIATTQPGLTSGWHHHGGNDTSSTSCRGTYRSGRSGGRRAVNAGPGDFLVIPPDSSTSRAPRPVNLRRAS